MTRRSGLFAALCFVFVTAFTAACDRPQACSSTNDCPAGEACIQRKCRAAGPSDRVCNTNADCSGGLVCLAGLCAEPGAEPQDGFSDIDQPDLPERELDVPACDDDGNPCTTGRLGPTGCVQEPTPGRVCDDGNPNTVSDLCRDDATCAGTPIVCNDNNECTVDAPDGDGGCSFVPKSSGTPCDDGNQCTSNDTCRSGGVCRGTARVCNDNNPCTTDACDPTAGCTTAPVAQGTVCNDGNACTATDQCDGQGACRGTTLNCADTNPCTDDTCDRATGCKNTAVVDRTCDDGLFCTTDDKCNAQGACAGAARDCGDGKSCTADACDEAAGRCTNTLNAAECLIDGVCYGDGQSQQGLACAKCTPARSQTAWTIAADRCTVGGSCIPEGEYAATTAQDACNVCLPALNQSAFSQPLPGCDLSSDLLLWVNFDEANITPAVKSPGITTVSGGDRAAYDADRLAWRRGGASVSFAGDTAPAQYAVPTPITNAFTMSFWFTAPPPDVLQEAIVVRFGEWFLLWTQDPSGGTPQLRSLSDRFSTDEFFALDAGAGVVTTSGWHHIAYVISAGRQALYVDGEFVGAQTACTRCAEQASSGDIVEIGGLSGDIDPEARFAGRIDDVRLYGRVLTLAEVQRLYGYPVR